MKPSLITRIATVTGIALGAFALSVLAWSPPTASAPHNNVDAPINEGVVTQYKNGGLMIRPTSGAGSTDTMPGGTLFDVVGNTILGSLTVTGATTLTGATTMGVATAGTLSVTNATTLNNTVTIPTSAGQGKLLSSKDTAGLTEWVTVGSLGIVGVTPITCNAGKYIVSISALGVPVCSVAPSTRTIYCAAAYGGSCTWACNPSTENLTSFVQGYQDCVSATDINAYTKTCTYVAATHPVAATCTKF